MWRLSPTAVTLIAAFLALLLVGYVFAGGSREDTDKLTDEQVAGRAETNSGDGCGSQQTYDLIKRELFRRAAQTRGSDHAAFASLSAYSAVGMDSPTRSSQDEQAGAITCTGSLSLDIPPGFQVVGGQRTLNANIGYSVAQATDGSGNVVTLSRADAVVAALATLARIGGEGSEAAAQPAEVDEAAADPQPTAEPQRPEVPRHAGRAPPAETPAAKRTAAQRPRATASPSFNCRRARTRSEIAVCGNAGLASLDRQMAGRFNRAMSGATPEQRANLQRTRSRFLARRELCRSVSCIADVYRARMSEIDALAAPRARPQPPAPSPPPQTAPPSRSPEQPVATTGPSFNCRLARTRGERAVCKDPGLASLDRQMATSYSSAMSQGTPAQRELLQHTRLRFLTYRDSCRSNSCVATSYRGRLKEISDIMAGRWKAY